MFLHRRFFPGFSHAVNRLLRSLPGIRHAQAWRRTRTPPRRWRSLTRCLNNMSHGLCMFGPDNRLLLWNDRYVKI
jgi:hypothetical protein